MKNRNLPTGKEKLNEMIEMMMRDAPSIPSIDDAKQMVFEVAVVLSEIGYAISDSDIDDCVHTCFVNTITISFLKDRVAYYAVELPRCYTEDGRTDCADLAVEAIGEIAKIVNQLGAE